jgi:hypothetical protein
MEWDRLGKKALWTIVAALVTGLFVVVVLFRHGMLAVLWAAACVALGGLVGFLFGIPKVLQGTAPPPQAPTKEGDPPPPPDAGYRLLLNTNLEQLSDWLTKIIVGVGLVELRTIPRSLQDGAEYIAAGLGSTDSSGAMALLLYFPICGFLGAYITMRLYLTRAFAQADQLTQMQAQDLADEVQRAAKKLPDKPDLATVPSVDDAKVARGVAARVSEQRTTNAIVRRQILDLAAEYELTRARMDRGPERTGRMQDVVNRMKTLAIAGSFALDELMTSDSVGARLAAIAFLQVTPRAEHLEWLGDELGRERQPFVLYQAAVALYMAANRLGAQDRPRVVAALDRAPQPPPAWFDSDIKNALDQARAKAMATQAP